MGVPHSLGINICRYSLLYLFDNTLGIMRNEGNVSKVAICPNCKGFILACHVDFIMNETKKEFLELQNEGFEIKEETIDDTKSREWADYEICINKKCKP